MRTALDRLHAVADALQRAGGAAAELASHDVERADVQLLLHAVRAEVVDASRGQQHLVTVVAADAREAGAAHERRNVVPGKSHLLARLGPGRPALLVGPLAQHVAALVIIWHQNAECLKEQRGEGSLQSAEILVRLSRVVQPTPGTAYCRAGR